jgi:hypothetical protein
MKKFAEISRDQASPMEGWMTTTKQDIDAALARLAEAFPQTFVLEKYRPHWPLKVGIAAAIPASRPETPRGAPMLSLSEAAKLAGQSKSTVWRAIKATGDYALDPAELHRVFPVERAATVSVKQDATGLERPETAAETDLRAEVAHLRQVGELLRSQLEDVKQDRDAWQGRRRLARASWP